MVNTLLDANPLKLAISASKSISSFAQSILNFLIEESDSLMEPVSVTIMEKTEAQTKSWDTLVLSAKEINSFLQELNKTLALSGSDLKFKCSPGFYKEVGKFHTRPNKFQNQKRRHTFWLAFPGKEDSSKNIEVPYETIKFFKKK